MVTVSRVVSSLELTSPQQLQPSPSTGTISLERWARPAAELKATHDEIAAPHRWPSLTWSQEDWQQRLDDPSLMVLAVHASGELAGLAAMAEQPGHQVEVTIFGLLPGFHGRGLGGGALTAVARRAWELPGTQRVWLHTSTRDGRHALANYLSRGFSVFATEALTEELPD